MQNHWGHSDKEMLQQSVFKKPPIEIMKKHCATRKIIPENSCVNHRK